MKKDEQTRAALVGGLCVLTCFTGCIYTSCKPVWQYDHLEQNAKKVITAAELQAWGTNLLALCSTDAVFKVSDLGTNFPKQLVGLAPKLGPRIWVYENFDTNSPSWIRLYWGSGMLGAKGFEIGPTNFVSHRTDRAWSPGVYFYYDH